MNSHPQHRRAVNVGSILLTPQENECLFGYLGRKCAVSLPFVYHLQGQIMFRCMSERNTRLCSACLCSYEAAETWFNTAVTVKKARCYNDTGDPSDSLTFLLFILIAVNKNGDRFFTWFVQQFLPHNLKLKTGPDINSLLASTAKKNQNFEVVITLNLIIFFGGM